MEFENIEARYITPNMGREFPLGDIEGLPRIIGPERDMVVLRGRTSSGIEAWSAIDTVKFPVYGSESTLESWALLQEVGSNFVGRKFDNPRQAVRSLGYMVGHYIFKAGFANLWIDAKAYEEGVPLNKLLGGRKDQVEIGISIPKSASKEEIARKISQDHYKRIKIKVGPSREDFIKVKAVRESFPHIKLMIDANSSFDLRRKEHQTLLDDFGNLNLLMMEQPLGHDDIIDHVKLQKSFRRRRIPGKVCLDESILTMDNLRTAIDGGIPIINIKVTRVGGLDIAKDMIEYCQRHGVDTWVGGMVELTSPGKAHSLAMAAHPGVTLPSDISGSAGYYLEGNDPYINPMVRESDGAYIKVPKTIGRGWDVDLLKMEAITKAKIVFNRR